MQRQRVHRFIFSLVLAGLLFAAGPAGCVRPGGDEAGRLQFQASHKYTLYIGINGKDSGKPAMTLPEAKAAVSAVCRKYAEGFTLAEAAGMWTDPEGRLTHEDTLVCIIVNIPEERLVLILNEILRDLDQRSILVEKTAPGSLFYYAPAGDSP